jgi:hypothetical protein
MSWLPFAVPMLAMRTLRQEDHVMSKPPIDEPELAHILAHSGLNLTPEQVRDILPGAALLLGMIARAQTSMPREAEPALTFNVEQR